MADLTEAEIKSCWRASMLAAADCCVLLSKLPAQGPTYVKLREHLKLAEGACRQMCQWREDARWLYLAPQLEQTRQMVQVMITTHYPRPLFLKLDQVLRKLVADADVLENARTGKIGLIVPKPAPLIRTESRPVQVVAQEAA